MILATLLLCLSTKMINPAKKASAKIGGNTYNYAQSQNPISLDFTASESLPAKKFNSLTISIVYYDNNDDTSIQLGVDRITNVSYYVTDLGTETLRPYLINLSKSISNENEINNLLQPYIKNNFIYKIDYYRLSKDLSANYYDEKGEAIELTSYNLFNLPINTQLKTRDMYEKTEGVIVDQNEVVTQIETSTIVSQLVINAYIDIPSENKSESDLKNSVYGLSELFPDFDTNSWIDWYCAYLCENGIKTPQELTSPYSYQVQIGKEWSWKDWRFHPVYETRIEPKGERQMLKKQEERFTELFQMVYASLEKDVQRYIENKKASYTSFADKYDELVPSKLVDKKPINLSIDVSVKGANYKRERRINIPLHIYRPLASNEDPRYYRLYLSHNDLDFLINDMSLRVVDLTHESFGLENKEFEQDTYITNYYKKVNAENGEVILDELISWCVPISVETYNKINPEYTPHFTISAVCEANKNHKTELTEYSIESSEIQNYIKNSAIRVFVAEETVINNMSTAEINATIVEGTTPPRYEMMMYMPATIVNDTIIAGIERVYNQNYGGSCKFVGVSEKRNSTELITTPIMITNAAPTKTLYVVTEKNQSKIIVQTNKSSAVMYANYNEKIDTSKLPTTLSYQGKEYEIIGWTEEKVLYPWDLGYGPGREYNKIDFETWTATKSQHYLSPVLKADLPVVIPDPEPEPEVGPGEDNILSPMVDGWNNFVNGWNEFFDNMFGIKDKTGEGFKIFMIIIGSIIGGGLLLGLLVRLIKWIKN